MVCFSGFLLLITLLIYLFYSIILAIINSIPGEGKENIIDGWIFRFSLNLLGYASVFVPGFALFLYVKKSNVNEKFGIFSHFKYECVIIFLNLAVIHRLFFYR